MPRQPGTSLADLSGKVVRVALNLGNSDDFATSGVTVLDLASIHTDAEGYNGGFSDGTHGYLVSSFQRTQQHVCSHGHC